MRHFRQLTLLGVSALWALSTLFGCKEDDEGRVQIAYTLLDRTSDSPIDCETAAVARIQLLLYKDVGGEPLTFTTDCNATTEGPGDAHFEVPGGMYVEMGIRMLRDDGGPSCLANRIRASWSFNNGEDGARVPKGGTTVLQDVVAEFFPGDLPVCGNGEREACEECDDGNTEDGDGCAANCLVEQAGECGNGEVEPGEDCDDGNTLDGDGCAADCRWERSDLTVEWSLSAEGEAATCQEMRVETFTLTLTPTGDATPLETLEDLPCSDMGVVFGDLDFGVFDLEILGRDADSQLTAYGETLGVTHTDFQGTQVTLEVVPFESP